MRTNILLTTAILTTVCLGCKQEPADPLASFKTLSEELKQAVEAEYRLITNPYVIEVDEPAWLEEKKQLVKTKNHEAWGTYQDETFNIQRSSYSRYYSGVEYGERKEVELALAAVPSHERRLKYRYTYAYEPIEWSDIEVAKTNSLVEPYIAAMGFSIRGSRTKTLVSQRQTAKGPRLKFHGTEDFLAPLSWNFKFRFIDGRWQKGTLTGGFGARSSVNERLAGSIRELLDGE